MILAHLSDLHLGFRAYARQREGENVREEDVAEAFHSAIREMIRLAPDVVLVAGDVFHSSHPTPPALVALARGVEGLRAALPGVRVLLVGGVHDTTAGPGGPGALAAFDALPNVDVCTVTSRAVSIAGDLLHVRMIPHAALANEESDPFQPDPGARWNVLLTHAAIGSGSKRLNIDPSEWDYVALGHEHGRRQVGPTLHYCGALERIGPDPWAEAAEEKGFLTYDLETRLSQFHPVRGRPVVSLAPVALSPDGSSVQEKLREVLAEVAGGIEEKIVRLPLSGFDPSLGVHSGFEALQELHRRALHLEVEIPRPGQRSGALLTALEMREELGRALARRVPADSELDRLQSIALELIKNATGEPRP